jgi:hypothetical protein
MVKRRIAETLVQELFLSLGYNVFRYGMENTIPDIMELLKGVRSDVAQELRRMPDFVMQNPKTKEIYFVEVKFRAIEELGQKLSVSKCLHYCGTLEVYLVGVDGIEPPTLCL